MEVKKEEEDEEEEEPCQQHGARDTARHDVLDGDGFVASPSLERLRRSTADDLKRFANSLESAKYRRAAEHRIYANRDVNLEKIEYIGFDMDYTLCAYKRPAYDNLQYTLICEALVDAGYPPLIKQWRFDSEFLIRGLLLDPARGNFVKCDQYGVVLRVLHGRWRLSEEQVARAYPSNVIPSSEVGERFISMDTLYHLAVATVYSDLVEYFDSRPAGRQQPVSDDDEKEADEAEEEAGGGQTGSAATTADAAADDTDDDDGTASLPPKPQPQPHRQHASEERNTASSPSAPIRLSYRNLWQDVRAAADIIHDKGVLKTRTLDNLDEYLPAAADDSVYRMLCLLRDAGKKLFLLTNSEYYYTNRVMQHIVGRFANPRDPASGWRRAFDINIVNARKPRFFRGGTALREIDVHTGRPTLDEVLTASMRMDDLKGRVLQGGSIDAFHELTGVRRGSCVLYVGDHVYADVLVARKMYHWRTLLVVPELSSEIRAHVRSRSLVDRLRTLEYLRAELFRGLDATAVAKPDVGGIQRELVQTREAIEKTFNRYAGGMFRSAQRSTMFAQQSSFFADLYSERCANLADYPPFYYFSMAVNPALPHEDQPDERADGARGAQAAEER